MNRLITVVIIAYLVMVHGATSQAAAYTDEAAWRAAVANVYALDNFDATPANTEIIQLPALGIKFDPLNDGTYPTVQPYSSTGGLVRSSPHNLLNDRDFSLPARGPYSMRAIVPTDLVFGVGLWNVGGDDRLRMTFLDANEMIIEQVISDAAIGFFGIANATGAERVQIDFVAGNEYSPVDDLQTAVRRNIDPTIPEPTSLALSGFAIGLWAITRLRSKRSSVR
jgi:hypothetical protein